MRKYERGQILLIVVLVMTIALTIGLSIATRTITELRTTTEQDTSERAFSAAEAGIEKALQDPIDSSGTFDNNASYETTITPISGQNILLNNGSPIIKNDAGDVWLSEYPGYTQPWTGTLSLHWGNLSDNCSTNPAALQIILIHGTKSDPILTHYPVDPCQTRAVTNNFNGIDGAGGTVLGKQFGFRRTINITSGLLIRIIPLYSSTTIGVQGSVPLPSQGKLITSVGKSDSTQRKILGVQENPKIPMQFFPYAIFSPL